MNSRRCFGLVGCFGSAVWLDACGSRDAVLVVPHADVGARVSANACRGRELDFDEVVKSCAHERPNESAPPSSVLQVALEAPSGGIPSGGSGTVWLRFRNVSTSMLALQLNSMCGGLFSEELFTLDGSRRADLEEEVGGLGLCGSVPGVRVELEPGGVLSRRFSVSGRMQRYVEPSKDSPLELVDGGPIAPGQYLLKVGLPLYSDHRLGWEGRLFVATPLTIAPAEK